MEREAEEAEVARAVKVGVAVVVVVVVVQEQGRGQWRGQGRGGRIDAGSGVNSGIRREIFKGWAGVVTEPRRRATGRVEGVAMGPLLLWGAAL